MHKKSLKVGQIILYKSKRLQYEQLTIHTPATE